MSNFCTQCGKPLNPQDMFCQNCGKRILPSQENEPQTVAAPASQPAVPASDPIMQNHAADQPQVYVNPAAASQPNQNPSQPVQPQTHTAMPDSPSAPKKKGNIGLTVGLCIAALAVMAAGFWLTRRPTPEPVVSVPPTVEPLPTALPTLPPIQPAPAETDVPQGIGDFAAFGISCDTVLNREYKYPGVYDDGGTEIPYGSLFFTDYTVEPLTEEILDYGSENGMDLAGYEKKTLSSKISFYQEDAYDRGVVITRYMTDYYDLNCLEDSGESFEDSYGETYFRYEIDDNGTKKYVYYFIESDWEDTENLVEYSETAIFLAPAGYDGLVRGYLNPNLDDVTEGKAGEDYFLFRMQ